MSRHILPLGMLVTIAILAVVFFTGREGQFAAAASRLPDQVLHRAQTLRSEMHGKVVILQDIVADEAKEQAEEPVLLESGVPAGDERAADGPGQVSGQATGQAVAEPAGAAVDETAGKPGRSGAAGAAGAAGAGDAAASGDASGKEGGGC